MSDDEEVLEESLAHIKEAIKKAITGTSITAVNIDCGEVYMDASGVGEIRDVVTCFVARREVAEQIKTFLDERFSPR